MKTDTGKATADSQMDMLLKRAYDGLPGTTTPTRIEQLLERLRVKYESPGADIGVTRQN
ncbi:hypothetical protein RNZ50_04990 [Paracoccaceae bacterium Fryx2]|nr:hypothetical protein [Paracoccaceae bacterium Fryx2]